METTKKKLPTYVVYGIALFLTISIVLLFAIEQMRPIILFSWLIATAAYLATKGRGF